MADFMNNSGVNTEHPILYTGLESNNLVGMGFDLTPDAFYPDGPGLEMPPPFDGYSAL
jgi:hypothetical protein